MDTQDTIDKIKLRKISSLDGSELFSSLEEKLLALHQKETITIPKYSKERPYTNNTLKRTWVRAKYFGAIMKQKAIGKDYPLIAVIVVNNHCNWNCTYCFGDYPNRREIDYTTDELKYLMDELHSLGCRYVNLHGGETLLRKDVGELVAFAKNKGMYVSAITNGSFFPERFEEIREVDSLTLSLDGRQENNDRVRGKGTFDKALSAIRLTIKKKIPLRVQATMTKYTMSDVGYLAQLAQNEEFHLQFSILFKPLKKAQDAQMSTEEIRATIQEIKKYKSLGYPIFTSDPVLDASYHWPYDFNDVHHIPESAIPTKYASYHIPCFYSRTKFTIEADGYIYPCFLTTDGSFKPKNWKNVGVAQAIEHVQKTNTCRACPAMTQNDHNALLGLSGKQVGYLIQDQLKEVFHIKNKVKHIH